MNQLKTLIEDIYGADRAAYLAGVQSSISTVKIQIFNEWREKNPLVAAVCDGHTTFEEAYESGIGQYLGWGLYTPLYSFPNDFHEVAGDLEQCIGKAQLDESIIHRIMTPGTLTPTMGLYGGIILGSAGLGALLGFAGLLIGSLVTAPRVEKLLDLEKRALLLDLTYQRLHSKQLI